MMLRFCSTFWNRPYACDTSFCSISILPQWKFTQSWAKLLSSHGIPDFHGAVRSALGSILLFTSSTCFFHALIPSWFGYFFTRSSRRLVVATRLKPMWAPALTDQTPTGFPNDLNTLGTLFAGRVMEMADRVAAVVAKRHSGRNCLTLGIDSVRFLARASHGDILIFKAAVNRVWRTSLEIGLKVFAEDFRTRQHKHIVSAYFTFVAV